MDSVQGYFGNTNTDLTEFVKRLVKTADLGSFYHYHYSKTADNLVEYELSPPSKFDGMKLKAFCIYHNDLML
jgi:hypothetical protein